MALTEKLAEFALGPVAGKDALQMARLSALDWAACGLAGREEPVARALLSLAEEEAGAQQASILGGGPRRPARMAALVNGTMSHALDYDDTHFAHIGHPSVAVFPAAMAVAEREGRSIEDMLQAALVGMEASVRFGVWLGRDHYQTGFHQTATSGAIGATVAACRLLGLTPERTVHALGLVATRASGLKSQFGTMGKPFNAGLAASNGVEAALLAQRGFISSPAALDGEQGFGPTHAGMEDDSAWDGLGCDWLFETVSHKFHACCHGLHAMLEAIATLRPGLDPSQIEAVSITTHPRWARVCNIPSPQTGLEAKFSYRLTAAMGLCGVSTASLANFSEETAADPALVTLRDKVMVDFDDSLLETQSRVQVVLAGGKLLEAAHDLNAPISLEARQQRLMAKAAALIGDNEASAIWDMLQGGGITALVAVLK